MRSVLLALACASVSVGAAGCIAKTKPCAGMTVKSDVVARAARLRLDIYDSSARCAGAELAPGAPPPSLSKEVAAGQSIKLDVPAGKHVLLLSAFADATATQLIGSACSATTVEANQPACFNLTLDDVALPMPDLAMPPLAIVDMAGVTPPPCTTAPDDCPAGQFCNGGTCAAGCKSAADCVAPTALCDVSQHRCVQCLSGSDCPAGQRCSPSGSCVDGCDPQAGSNCAGALMCCSNLCLDTSKDILNCGACGRACSSAQVAVAGCSGSVCAPTCSGHYGDCKHPLTGADDGCETNLWGDVNNCGACNNTCTVPGGVAGCPMGSCTIASCNAGKTNCDGKAATGCSCDLIADTNKGCCSDGSCEKAHSDGLGDTFHDCTAIGTYTIDLAREAAKAYAPNVASFDAAKCGPDPQHLTVSTVCSETSGECVCWAFADTGTSMLTGFVRRHQLGKPLDMGLAPCLCPEAGNAETTTWK